MQGQCERIKQSECYDSSANFLLGGDSSASTFREASSFSTFRFVPPSFDCGDGECEALMAVIKPCLGGVDLDDCTSGVPERLPNVCSFRSRAAKLFVEATASAWHVAWYICQKDHQ